VLWCHCTPTTRLPMPLVLEEVHSCCLVVMVVRLWGQGVTGEAWWFLWESPPPLSHLRPGPSVIEVGGPHSWVVGRGRGDLSGRELPVENLGPCEHVPLPVTRPSWLVEWAEGPR